MARSRVLVAGSNISTQQMERFWRMNSDGSINGPRLQRFLDNPSWGGDAAEVTLARAINILGTTKVVMIDHAANVRGRDMSVARETGTDVIRYSEATLRKCAEENRSDGTDWRLVYCCGLSLVRIS